MDQLAGLTEEARKLSLYRRFGLTALARKRRTDASQHREMPAKLKEAIEGIAQETDSRSQNDPRSKTTRSCSRVERSVWRRGIRRYPQADGWSNFRAGVSHCGAAPSVSFEGDYAYR